jgi:hypothetical protein
MDLLRLFSQNIVKCESIQKENYVNYEGLGVGRDGLLVEVLNLD